MIMNKKVIIPFRNVFFFYLTVNLVPLSLLVCVALTYMKLHGVSLYGGTTMLLTHPLLLDTWIFSSFSLLQFVFRHTFFTCICVLVHVFP